MICDDTGLLRFTLRKIKCEFIEPRAPNNFMTTTCRIVVIKNCRLEGVKSFTSIYCLSALVHKQCFAIDDDSIFRTFKRQVCLVVLLFYQAVFCASASALRVCLSGIRYWFFHYANTGQAKLFHCALFIPFRHFSLAIFIAASFSGVAT
ncbi:Uncharacterised protein [Escherichia coli]|uniref:Uncharacterized protein n=1 Tax=Escherichia coli TaxID=562 RepID=A0A376VHM9_ECOLX|nr:Uncharacterised protein [Escherichia coli]